MCVAHPRRFHTLGLVLLIVVFASAPARADLTAYESFDYAPGTDIFGESGGEGFFGEWLQYGGAPVLDSWEVFEGSLDYPGLQTAGNHVTSEAHAGDAWVGLLREFDGDVDGATRYASILIRPEGDVGAGSFNGAFGLIFAGSGGNGDVSLGKTDGSDDYMIETFFNTSSQFSDVPAESEETTLVVVKAELMDGDDRFTMYLNPTPGEPEPATGTVKDDLDVGFLIGLAIGAAGAVSMDELRWGDTFADVTPVSLTTVLQAGDADQDFDFDQIDLVQVQVAGKYLTGQASTWGEGDWNGAPGGSVGNPPAGDGQFDQLDIIAALNAGFYLTGPYAAVADGGQRQDGQTSVVYDASTGELAVDAPAGTELTSINIDSAASIFTGESAQNLGGSFDNDADDNIFKATFGGSFGSLNFGKVAQTGLSQEFVLGDLTVVGSLQGGGGLGDVDLVYVPEPATALLLVLACVTGTLLSWRRRGFVFATRIGPLGWPAWQVRG